MDIIFNKITINWGILGLTWDKQTKKKFCCGPQCYLSVENWPANQKVWSIRFSIREPHHTGLPSESVGVVANFHHLPHVGSGQLVCVYSRSLVFKNDLFKRILRLFGFTFEGKNKKHNFAKYLNLLLAV
jgi:hypothetical protein